MAYWSSYWLGWSEKKEGEKPTDGSAETLAAEQEGLPEHKVEEGKASSGEGSEQQKQTEPLSETFHAESDLQKQKKFEREQRRQKDAAVPPWVSYKEDKQMKALILELSADSRNVLCNPPPGVQFHFDFARSRPVAMATLREDSRLQKLRFKLVPKKITEEQFWHNYLYSVFLIKQSCELSTLTSELQKEVRALQLQMIDLGGGDQEGIHKQLEEESAQKKLFEKCMGLKFVITEACAFSLVFTNVDPDNPGKKFTITLDVDEDRQQLTLVSVDPAVPGVRVLLNEFNRTQNWRQFCKGIRKKFKETINSTS